MSESCDVCRADKGLTVTAIADAPLPCGRWAFVCKACHYRLPASLRAQAVAL